MASFRPISTPEDVLDLLRDVEEDIQRGKGQGTASGTGDDKVQSTSREQWPPHREHSAHATSGSMLKRPYVQLPPQQTLARQQHGHTPAGKLPPALQTASHPLSADDQYSPRQYLGLPRPLVQNEAWIARFNGLFNRASQSQPPQRPETFSSQAYEHLEDLGSAVETPSFTPGADDMLVDGDPVAPLDTNTSPTVQPHGCHKRKKKDRKRRRADGMCNLDEDRENQRAEKRVKGTTFASERHVSGMQAQSDVDEMDYSSAPWHSSPAAKDGLENDQPGPSSVFGQLRGSDGVGVIDDMLQFQSSPLNSTPLNKALSSSFQVNFPEPETSTAKRRYDPQPKDRAINEPRFYERRRAMFCATVPEDTDRYVPDPHFPHSDQCLLKRKSRQPSLHMEKDPGATASESRSSAVRNFEQIPDPGGVDAFEDEDQSLSPFGWKNSSPILRDSVSHMSPVSIYANEGRHRDPHRMNRADCHEQKNQPFRDITPDAIDRHIPYSGEHDFEQIPQSSSSQVWVEPGGISSEAIEPLKSTIGFEDLPSDVQDRVLSIFLKSEDPIHFETTHLLPKLKELAQSSVAAFTDDSEFLSKSPSELRCELLDMKDILSDVPQDEWRRAPSPLRALGLKPALLLLSKNIHERASNILYGKNVFQFSGADNAWIHLESFLATIGARNSARIRHLRLAAPKWHRGVSRDAVTGAVLDAMSPMTRLAVFDVPAEDRLLSAVLTCAGVLGPLESMQIDVRFPENVIHFIADNPEDPQYPIHISEEQNHLLRKQSGVEALKRLSDTLGPANKPLLVMETGLKVKRPVAKTFRTYLARMIREAEKYGWTVDQFLHESVRIKYSKRH